MCGISDGDTVEFRSEFTERLGVVELVHDSVGPGGVNYLTIRSTGLRYLRREDEVTQLSSNKDRTISDLEGRVWELEQSHQEVAAQRDKAQEGASDWKATAEAWQNCYQMASNRAQDSHEDLMRVANKAGSLRDQFDRLAKHFNLPDTWGPEEIVNDLVDTYPTPRLYSPLRRFKDCDGDTWVEGADGKFRMEDWVEDWTDSVPGWSLLGLHRCFSPLKSL